MAVVGWFLFFFEVVSFFFLRKKVFFSICDVCEKKVLVGEKNCHLRQKKGHATYAKKKNATDAFFRNQATLSPMPRVVDNLFMITLIGSYCRFTNLQGALQMVSGGGKSFLWGPFPDEVTPAHARRAL